MTSGNTSTPASGEADSSRVAAWGSKKYGEAAARGVGRLVVASLVSHDRWSVFGLAEKHWR